MLKKQELKAFSQQLIIDHYAKKCQKLEKENQELRKKIEKKNANFDVDACMPQY